MPGVTAVIAPAIALRIGFGRVRIILASARPLPVSVVACENLVSSIARESDGHVAPRHLRHEIGGDLRGVGERLVVDVLQFRNDGLRLCRRYVELGMLGAQM